MRDPSSQDSETVFLRSRQGRIIVQLVQDIRNRCVAERVVVFFRVAGVFYAKGACGFDVHFYSRSWQLVPSLICTPGVLGA